MPQDSPSSNTLVFFVNGSKVEDAAFDPECSLLVYLRSKLRLCGTKLGCGEGGCGACTVMLSKYHRAEDQVKHYSVNACLTLVASVHGLAVTTVEGIGSTKTGLHAAQERLAKAHGSQCGFCTPGIVMSMYTLLRNNPRPTMVQLDEYFTGNLCRCTGYRPILEGYRSLTTSAAPSCGKANCCMLNDGGWEARNGEEPVKKGKMEGLGGEPNQPAYHLVEFNEMRPYDPSQEIIFPPELKAVETMTSGARDAIALDTRLTYLDTLGCDIDEQSAMVSWKFPVAMYLRATSSCRLVGTGRPMESDNT